MNGAQGDDTDRRATGDRRGGGLRLARTGLRVDRALRLVWRAAPAWTAASAALVIAQGLIPVATLYVLKLIVDRFAPGVPAAASSALPAGIYGLIAAALALAVLAALCSALLGHAATVQAQLVADRMHGIVQAKSLDVDLAYYEDARYFDKLHRAQREAPSRPLRIVRGLIDVARNLLTLAAAFAVVLQFHWGVCAAVLVASLPVVYYRLRHSESLHALEVEKTASERLARYYDTLLTTAEHAKEVRAFAFGPLVAGWYAELRGGLRKATQALSRRGQLRQFATESLAALVAFSALAFIVGAAWRGAITLGDLVLYFGAFQVALGALRPALAGLAELYENNLFLSALDEFLRLPRRVADPPMPRPMIVPWQRGVAVEGVAFGYPGTTATILADVELRIPVGHVVALVGRNGSGKTTLAKLLCRLHDPVGGRITIDGVDLRDFAVADVRRHVGVVFQDFGRYQLAARENIRIGRPELSAQDARIALAARAAGIHDELLRLPEGYDTRLGRTLAAGAELSLGQWQRLALARALVADAQLVVLDEPTSSVDAAAELAFFERFRTLIAGRSALLISHRFSTVRHAHRIYVLDQGRIVEQGSHDELVARDGVYAELFRPQAAPAPPDVEARSAVAGRYD